MWRRMITISLFVVLLLGSVGAWGKANTAFPQGKVVDVAMQDFVFAPDSLIVSPGTTVRWTNQAQFAHTSTEDSDPPLWDSGLLNPGESFTFTFTDAGTFSYHCTPHQAMGMVGTVTVTDGGKESGKNASRK